MKKTVNFDVDGTLITGKGGKPRPSVVKMVKEYQHNGYQATIWSRRGKMYAKETAHRLGITNVKHASKNVPHNKPDVAVDDKEYLGKKNIIV